MKPIGVSELKNGNLGAYASRYLSNLNEISHEIRNHDGVKTHVRINSEMDPDDLIRASLVLSDLTTLAIDGGGTASLSVSKEPRQIKVPIDMLKQFDIDPNKSEINFGVFQSTAPTCGELAKNIMPFIEAGSLVIKPQPFMIFKLKDHHWHSLPLIHGENRDEWVVNTVKELDGELPVRVDTETKIPFDLVVPYLKGLSWSEYHEVMKDAEGTLITLRSALRKGIREIEEIDQRSLNEFKQDVIAPEIEALRRHFTKASSIHKIRVVGATVGSLSLSLSALWAPGLAAPISGLLGAGSFGLLAKEYAAYREKIQSMKDNPYYIFWRAAHTCS